MTATRYLGLRLKHPFVAGASPLSAHLDSIRRLEDAGAAAVVLHSLFEEQITEEQSGRIRGMDPGDDRFADSTSQFPSSGAYPFRPHEYLEHVSAAKSAVAIPVIASLNGSSAHAWLRHAALLEQAGADALEVNWYEVVADPNVPGIAVETNLRDAVLDLKRSLRIPVAIKLSPFFTAFADVARQLDAAGADGLVIFNRFYQPDIDITHLTTTTGVELSRSAELRLRIRWLAILHGRLRASLAVTGGVHTPADGIKAILAGAHAVQMVSALLRSGPEVLTGMVRGLTEWMDEHQVSAVDDMRGRVSLKTVAHPGDFERAHYIQTLHQWERKERE